MKIKIIVFLMAFLIGYAFVPTTKDVSVPVKSVFVQQEKLAAFQQALSTSQVRMEIKEEPEDENWDEQIPSYKIKLLTTGQFHGDEIKAKTGERWLGLFKERNNYFLRFTQIKVRRVHDDIVDNDKEKTGKEITFEGRNEPIFLLKNAKMLSAGKIKTIFESRKDGDSNLQNGSTKKFGLNGTTYTLKVVSNKSTSEYLDPTSKLILVSGNTEQVIYSLGACDDCGWSLQWVGDLDGDGKLDLYGDFSYHYNVQTPRLFLSSEAPKGKLVKEVAAFFTVGC